MYCPNCKEEFPGKFCPECGTKMVETPKQNDFGVNISDDAAIMGGVNVTRNESHNSTSYDQRVINNSTVTNNIVERQKTDAELRNERNIKFLELCKQAFSDGLLDEEEKIMLATERLRLGISEEEANRLIEMARRASVSRMNALSMRDSMTLKTIDRYIDGNNAAILKGQVSRLAALARNYKIDEVQYRYYMLMAALCPDDLIREYEGNIADDYWQTYWAAIAYMKKNDSLNAEDAIVKLDVYTEYPEDNSLLLSALSTYRVFGAADAAEFIGAILPDQCYPLLMPFIHALFLEIAPERAVEVGAQKETCQFYLDNIVNLESPEKKAAARKAAEEEAARKAAEELARKTAEAEVARKAAEELARKTAEAEAARKAAEELARKTAEIEAARKATAEATARKAAEEAAAANRLYDVVMTSAGSAKLSVVKAVKEGANLSLLEAKNLVDDVPSTIGQGLSKADAELLKSSLEDCGARVELIENAEEAAAANRLYDVVMTSAGSAKLSVVKAVKEGADLSLLEAKNLVDNVPSTIGEGLSKADAELLKSSLEDCGARVELRVSSEDAEARKKRAIEIYNTGDDYYYGRNGREKNLVEAAKYYRKSAELGYSKAQNDYGYCCKNGYGVDENYAEAVRWYRKAAEQGNVFAQNNMGICYELGRGVDKDYAEAVKWYRKSAEQGYSSAQSNLADCYKNGDGVDKNLAEAVKWYRKAAEQGDEGAKKKLKELGY